MQKKQPLSYHHANAPMGAHVVPEPKPLVTISLLAIRNDRASDLGTQSATGVHTDSNA